MDMLLTSPEYLPHVSVIMPAFNAQATIRAAIDSVISQTYKEWELIIVNDGSDDQTKNIVEEYCEKNHRIRLINQINLGLPTARNTGVKVAKADWIAFLDSDDMWLFNKLDSQLKYHLSSNYLISHTNFYHLNIDGKIIKRNLMNPFTQKEGLLFRQLLHRNVVGVLTVIINKKLFYDVGGFDETLWTMEDIDLWVRVAQKKVRFKYISKPLAIYRINENGISSSILRYRTAYFHFLKKIETYLVDENIFHDAYAIYYRHFGVEFLKRNKFFFAKTYLRYSLKHSFSIINITYILLKSILFALKK